MPADFFEHRLPESIERDAEGGSGFKTTILTGDSGHEQREITWEEERGEWDLAGHFMKLLELTPNSEIQEMNSFFHVQRGRAIGFRYKDPVSFNIGDFDNPTTDNQSIGTGTGSSQDIQCFRRYAFAAEVYDYIVTKLVTGKIVLLWDDVVKATPGDYTVDVNTGIFTTGPAGGVDIQVALQYDTPVRFNMDKLKITRSLVDLGIIPDMPIVELKPTL